MLTTFADLCELSRNRPTGDEESVGEHVHSPREYFHTYLQSLDVSQDNLPESFRVRLSRALRHDGVDDLEPGPRLEKAVYRIFLAQQRAADHVPVVAALLERWLTHPEGLTGPARDEIGEVIDRLVIATQLRYPAVGNLTRSVRFRLFEEPLIEQAREAAYARVRHELDYLRAHTTADDRAERIEAMAALTQPMIRLLGESIIADSHGPQPLLEVATRRYYKVRALEDVRSFLRDGRQFVTGSFDLLGSRLHVVSTVAEFDDLPRAAESASALAREVEDPTNLVVDLYVTWVDAPDDTDEVAQTLHGLLADVPLLNEGRRVTVTVFDAGAERVRQVTLRPSGEGLREDRVIRDMHPLTGQRLDLWRLKNFDGTRLPAAENTYLFHCVAKDNPADVRLVALAEVLDVEPLHDASGRIRAFPAVERALAACLDSIRRDQAQRRGERLEANRSSCTSGPPWSCSSDDLLGFARSAVPLTVGAGLEEVMLLGRLKEHPGQEPRDVALTFTNRPGFGVEVSVAEPPTEPVPPLDDYAEKVRRSRARGTTYPYELVPHLTRSGGTFTEYDLDASGLLVPVERPPGRNTAGIVAGVVSTPTDRYPEGMTRVALFGDPTKALGSVAEPECSLVMAAVDLAEQMRGPRRVVRVVLGREDLDGQRHREHGLGRPSAASARSRSPRTVARSTSSWPASTSAPSRTGTPRPPC